MPELPEVETVRQVLEPLVKDHVITKIDILKKRIILSDEDEFVKLLTGSRFKTIKRIGKYLIFIFTNDLVLVSHLRMEGKYIEILPGQELSRFARVVFHLDDGRSICYDDSRQFGTMELSDLTHYQNLMSINKLGPEPFYANHKDIYQRFQKISRPIKEALLDQTIMTGLGNIYADEVLFLAKLHPETPVRDLDLLSVKQVIKYAIEVLNKALIAGGSTIRSYHAGNGITGDFQSELNAYGREYLNCFVCKHKMKKIFVGGRGSTYCPHCQRNRKRPLMVAITGLIGAGKSTIGQYIKSKGYEVIDADEIVKKLYENLEVTKQLETLLGLSLHNEGRFNRQLLKDALVEDHKRLKIVESLIHPLVKLEIQNIMNTSSDKVLFFEVPLVFNIKINELFSYIIGVETDIETQKRHLAKRGKTVLFSPDVSYLKNRPKLDYIIINNSTLKKLYQAVDKVLLAIDI